MSLTLRTMSATGYRSLRAIRFPVDRLTVFVGANGVGKTNLYRALQLVQAAATGALSRELAAEGGMESAYWAGDRKGKGPVRITMNVGFATEDSDRAAYGYEVSAGVAHSYELGIGVRIPTAAAFLLEPQVKEESLAFHDGRRAVKLLERRGPSVIARDEAGVRQELGTELMASETALGSIEDPARFPDLHLVRSTLRDWRFYHELRADAASALRQPCLAVTSPTLSSDGDNLAAVFATLVHIREDTADLDRAVADAFPGAKLEVPSPGRTASFGVRFPEFPARVFQAGELSDGTLRYLALAGALLAYRLPALVVLNEPETSLHPDLLDPLARMIVRAAERTQVLLVTHSERLADALAEHGGIKPRTVVKRGSETWIEGLRNVGEFAEED
ncbi:MAG TPA: AAA family ATPase [Candidatus Cybelea sp.]|nr:AAA family ATPase [Candidatus Cybelea sp.]